MRCRKRFTIALLEGDVQSAQLVAKVIERFARGT
jgi:hypothetical protein